MLEDLKRIGQFLKSDEKGQSIKKKLLIISIIIISAVILNRYFFVSQVIKDVNIRLEQSKILIQSESTVYEQGVHEYLKNQQLEKGFPADDGDFDYESPVINLVFIYPLTFLLPEWAAAILLTINQIGVFIMANLLLRLTKTKLKQESQLLFYALIFAPVFILTAIININSTVPALCMLVGALHFDVKNQKIISGILMGLGFFISLDLFIIAATTFAVFIKRKRVANIIWAIITIALCVLFALIFERSWILNWLKTLFLSPSRFPFLAYANVLTVNYQTEITRIIIVVPILLISWLILEIWRTATDSEVEALWLISIGGIVNHLLMISLYSSPSISLILPLVMLVIVWVDRFSQKQKLIFLGTVFFLSLIPTMGFYFNCAISKWSRTICILWHHDFCSDN